MAVIPPNPDSIFEPIDIKEQINKNLKSGYEATVEEYLRENGY